MRASSSGMEEPVPSISETDCSVSSLEQQANTVILNYCVDNGTELTQKSCLGSSNESIVWAEHNNS